VKFGLVFDLFHKRQLRSREQAHRNLGLSDSGETAMEFEFADDTGTDYASYDAVAQDRAAAGE
jgi:hypothetical protein